MGQKKKKIAAEAAKNFHRKRHEGTKKHAHTERKRRARAVAIHRKKKKPF